MNTSLAPARGVIWSFNTTSPGTETTLLRLTVFSGRSFAFFGFDVPGPDGRFCGGIIPSLVLGCGMTPGALSRSCSTCGGFSGAGGKKLVPLVPGGQGG